MKNRWIKLGALACLLLVTTIVGLFAWLSWPTSGTLVGQAARDDITGLKRSLFLGADINGYSMWGWHRENRGDTPLTSAVQYGSLGTVDFLLTRGADPNQRDGSGMPPICWAAIHNRLDAAKTLVEQGAEVELPDIDHYGNPKKKSIDYALSEGYDELAAYLQSKSEQAVDGNPH